MTAPLNGASVNGQVAVVNGVVFGGSMDADGTMYAFDATSGKVLWSFQSGATVYGGPAIADGVVFTFETSVSSLASTPNASFIS